MMLPKVQYVMVLPKAGRDGALEVEMVLPKKEVVLPKVQYVMLLPKVAMVLPKVVWYLEK